MGEMEERCRRNHLQQALSVFGRPERAGVLDLLDPGSPRKTVLEKISGNIFLGVYNGRDREAIMEILDKSSFGAIGDIP